MKCQHLSKTFIGENTFGHEKGIFCNDCGKEISLQKKESLKIKESYMKYLLVGIVIGLIVWFAYVEVSWRPVASRPDGSTMMWNSVSHQYK